MQRFTCLSAGAACLCLGAGVAAAAQATGAAGGGTAAQTARQAAAGAGAGQAQTGVTRVHGTIADPDGAAIPGATVLFTPPKGAPRTVKSGADGTYSVSLVPGAYNLLVTMPGFSSYAVQSLKIAAVPSLTVDAKLQIGQQEVVINVDANAVTLSVDPDANASSTVIQGKDLEALSDDPDELSSELSALAGPAAGPNGGQIYVDGFTGGQLPPKSSIREIRINQNPFSAEYDRIGYGRVEVFTKPGTDTYHGNFQVNGNPSQFNSPNPLSGAYEPPYHTIFMFGNITGPIGKATSFSVGGSHRDIEDNEFTNATILAPTLGSTTLCPIGQTAGCVVTQAQIFTHFPQVRTDISPRFDFALGEKNVLTARFQYVQNDTINGGVGLFTLPTAAYNSSSKYEELQLSDTQTFSSKLINETRFEWERDRSADASLSNAPFITVQGTLGTGGNPTQNTSDHTNHYEVQNYTSLALKKNFIRFGGRLRDTREAQYAAGNTNGSFTYAYLTYQTPAPGVCPPVPDPNDAVCNDFSYATGRPTQFTLSELKNTDIHYNYFDLGLYAEDDWKPLPNLTFSYGVRYETQNYLPNDHHDWAPRLSLAYGLGKNNPKTVLRAGFGMFYDRFGTNYILNTIRYNGLSEILLSDQNPSAACGPATVAACAAEASVGGSSTYVEATGAPGQYAPVLRAPYTIQGAGGLDQQLWKRGTVSVNYIHSQEVHQIAEQNIACPFPFNASTSICSPTTVTNEYFSEGYVHQDQLFFNGRVQTAKRISLFGFYGLNFAKGDSSGGAITVPYDIKADYGRTAFETRQRLFLGGSVTLPWLVQFSPFVIAQSGNPYNVTLGTDQLQDSYFNERPVVLPIGMTNGGTIKAIPSCGLAFADQNANPQLTAGFPVAPINACTGPNLFTFNFRLTKAIGFGEKTRNQNASGGQGGPGGGRGGPGGGGGGRGGFGGGTTTGRRYSVNFGVNVQNLFNNTDPGNPIGNLSSSQFGKSINLAGGPFTQQSAVRRLSLQASFNF